MDSNTFKPLAQLKRMMLIIHPVSGKVMTFTAKTPKEFGV